MTRAVHHRRAAAPAWLRILKGLLAAVGVTVAGVAVFALLMQWLRPAESLVRIINQVLKLVSIGAGVCVAVGRGCEGGLLKGALVGLLYMAVGVGMYALLSGQSASVSALLADLGMGVAGGGIVGMLLSNM
ncbi:MAG: TIGR04086 family membrane protein [Clostridia bacterium]|nr:TIGR04086 family membrane protein [Clostridia bacterium]